MSKIAFPSIHYFFFIFFRFLFFQYTLVRFASGAMQMNTERMRGALRAAHERGKPVKATKRARIRFDIKTPSIDRE